MKTENPYQSPESSAGQPIPSSAQPASPNVLGLSLLFGLMYFVQGIGEPVEGLIAQPVRTLLGDWGYSAGQVGSFVGLVALPWSLKPIYGLLTDFVPILGSRRRSYLLLTSGATVLGLGFLFFFPLPPGSYTLLLCILLLPTIGVAFSDVVVDALMVEKGQPIGMTGRFQSIQWAAIYTATILTGYLGGLLSHYNLQTWGFGICAAATTVTFAATWLYVRDDRPADKPDTLANASRALVRTVTSPGLLVAGAFLFLWNFNPFTNTVLMTHMTEQHGMSEVFYGLTVSVFAVGAVVGSVAYGFYCRRVPLIWLVHLSILAGVVSTVLYWQLHDHTSALVISFIVGVTYLTGSLVQLDLAARVCLKETAGTTFALLMALSNFSMSCSEIVGGWIYDLYLYWATRQDGFDALVGIGAAFTCACWFLVPLIHRQIKIVEQAEAAEKVVTTTD